MHDRVLVTYASKHGGTAEIADRIADVLVQRGVEVAVLPVDQVDDPAAYGAVVLGAAIYMGSWHRHATRFLKRHVEALAARPVWMFASGPTGLGEPEDLVDGHVVQDALEPVIERIAPRDVVLFHGRLDPDHLGWFERFIIRNVGADTGDYRDWDAIEGWARGVGEALAQGGTGAGAA